MSAVAHQTRGQRDDAILTSRGIPLSFGLWKYSVWNKTQLLYAIRTLGGNDLTDDTKRNLFQRLHRLRPAISPLSDQELDELRRVRHEGKISSRSAIRDVSIPGQTNSTPVKQEDVTDENKPLYARLTESTHRQSQLAQTCEVCTDNMTPELTLTEAVTQECKHPIQIGICKTCVEHHIRVQIASNGWDNITCPVQECRKTLMYNDIQNMASTADFERYDAHLFEKAMREGGSSDYRHCAHANCAGRGWCDPVMESFMTCPTCAQLTCVECDVVWHTDKTCAEHKEEVRIQKEEEAAERAAAEAESAKYVEENYKACPNKGCGYRIEKNGGCDHMTCRRCWHQFCWICDADYKEVRREGNTAHLKSCTYHSNHIGD